MGKGFRERIKSNEGELVNYNVFLRRATLILTIAFWRRQRIGKVLTYFEQVVVNGDWEIWGGEQQEALTGRNGMDQCSDGQL